MGEDESRDESDYLEVTRALVARAVQEVNLGCWDGKNLPPEHMVFKLSDWSDELRLHKATGAWRGMDDVTIVDKGKWILDRLENGIIGI